MQWRRGMRITRCFRLRIPLRAPSRIPMTVSYTHLLRRAGAGAFGEHRRSVPGRGDSCRWRQDRLYRCLLGTRDRSMRPRSPAWQMCIRDSSGSCTHASPESGDASEGAGHEVSPLRAAGRDDTGAVSYTHLDVYKRQASIRQKKKQ